MSHAPLTPRLTSPGCGAMTTLRTLGRVVAPPQTATVCFCAG